MLERIQAKIGQTRRFRMSVDSEDTTLFTQFRVLDHDAAHHNKVSLQMNAVGRRSESAFMIGGTCGYIRQDWLYWFASPCLPGPSPDPVTRARQRSYTGVTASLVTALIESRKLQKVSTVMRAILLTQTG